MGPPERTGLQRKTRLASGAACAAAAGPVELVSPWVGRTATAQTAVVAEPGCWKDKFGKSPQNRVKK